MNFQKGAILAFKDELSWSSTIWKVNLAVVPNILNITYGRDVGYKIEQEKFDKQIEEISATKIRSKSTWRNYWVHYYLQ